MRGQVKQRGKSWVAIIYLGRVGGKEKYQWRTFKKKRDAERYKNQAVATLEGGGIIPTTRKLTEDYLNEWLSGHAPQIAPTTLASYRDALRVHLRPALGSLPLRKLGPQHIRDYITTKLAAGRSPKTVSYHRTILSTALEQAVRDGLLPRNAAALVEAPAKVRREMRALDVEQATMFLGEARRSSPFYRLYLAALLTGMRQGELAGLRWQDCNFAANRAAIQQTFYRLGGSKAAGTKAQALFKEPKTDRGRRSIPLAPELVSELLALRDEQRARRKMMSTRYQDHDLIFCQNNGKPLHFHNVVRRDFHRALALEGLRSEMREKGVPEDALPKGLPQVRFHDLRHSTASLLLARGVHPKVVQELLGHSSAQITLDTYSHAIPALAEQAVIDLGALLVASSPGGI